VSILFAFAGWILLAPGAVYISGITRPITTRANGIISLAGPATTFVVALAFLPFTFLGSPLVSAVAYMGWRINIWLTLFNMVPAPGFDGNKVLAWNKPVYFGFGLFAVALFFLFKGF
jgi:Zn-dependent protease